MTFFGLEIIHIDICFSIESSFAMNYSRVNAEASGYYLELYRENNLKMNAVYRLMEDILSKGFECFYKLRPKFLHSNKLVILADFLPNMAALSLESWTFFHIKYGTVYVECKLSYPKKEYSCFVAKKNICRIKNHRLTTAEMNDHLFFCGNFPVIDLLKCCCLRNNPSLFHFS